MFKIISKKEYEYLQKCKRTAEICWRAKNKYYRNNKERITKYKKEWYQKKKEGK